MAGFFRVAIVLFNESLEENKEEEGEDEAEDRQIGPYHFSQPHTIQAPSFLLRKFVRIPTSAIHDVKPHTSLSIISLRGTVVFVILTNYLSVFPLERGCLKQRASSVGACIHALLHMKKSGSAWKPLSSSSVLRPHVPELIGPFFDRPKVCGVLAPLYAKMRPNVSELFFLAHMGRSFNGSDPVPHAGHTNFMGEFHHRSVAVPDGLRRIGRQVNDVQNHLMVFAKEVEPLDLFIRGIQTDHPLLRNERQDMFRHEGDGGFGPAVYSCTTASEILLS
ncbi:hypothetical protein GXP70_07695 [Paenibacillus lycopersici]|uniref:Uncharacterized protein n=1 Tax=Paenibacillus lycopersici TaxID=2704462 RepID=A0A6C0FX27_9BACL|nr:hypothetical protein [Paenibacillus lycopersici]QHT59844.1 hypothetical protein GXP70_07695 [Paenibacillus lycopersici]